MLVKCPECGLQVSDKAFSCPHCGYPFEKSVNIIKRKSSRRKRLPNGFGQITELKNKNLRKPFRAMVTVGFNENGRPISKLLKPESYFKTYNEAYEALIKYNSNPYSLNSNLTVMQLYEEWYPKYIKTIDKKTALYIRPALNRLEPLHNMRIQHLRKVDIKELLINADTTPRNIEYMKRLITLMLNYAVESEYVSNNVAADININSILQMKTKSYATIHTNFSDDELKILIDNKDNLFVKIVLLQCFMGWRPNEILNITKDNVNINEWYIVGGMKTENGRNRKVPIHPFIRDIIEYFYYQPSNNVFLINDFKNGIYSPVSYAKYNKHFVSLLKEYNLSTEHKLHDGRVTFITLCKKYNVDEYAIKYMVGHSIQDLTEKTYTKRDIEWLKTELLKIDLMYE